MKRVWQFIKEIPGWVLLVVGALLGILFRTGGRRHVNRGYHIRTDNYQRATAGEIKRTGEALARATDDAELATEQSERGADIVGDAKADGARANELLAELRKRGLASGDAKIPAPLGGGD